MRRRVFVIASPEATLEKNPVDCKNRKPSVQSALHVIILTAQFFSNGLQAGQQNQIGPGPIQVLIL
jgi:hypothetical protein